jgi:hypothetical protein
MTKEEQRKWRIDGFLKRGDHHMNCLGLLAKIGIQSARLKGDRTFLYATDYAAVRQAIEEAEELGLPVSVARFDAGQSISTNDRQ